MSAWLRWLWGTAADASLVCSQLDTWAGLMDWWSPKSSSKRSLRVCRDKAAEQGHTSAQFNLGSMYDDGRGVVQDYKEAVKWYRKAAEQGDAGAQYNLGVMYLHGTGVIEDYVYGRMWLIIASMSGHKEAIKVQKEYLKEMPVTDIATANQLARKCVLKKYKGC